MIKRERAYSIVSSFIFLIPGVLAIFSNQVPIAVLLFCMSFVSAIYHHHKPNGLDWWWNKNRNRKQTILLYLDTFLSWVVTVFMVLYVLSHAVTPLSIVGLVVLMIGLFFLFYPKGDYEVNHSVWHLLASFSAVLILL